MPLVLSFSCIACVFFSLYLPYFPFAFAFIKIITNFVFDAGVLGFVVGVGKAPNLDVRAFLKAGNSLLKAGDYRVGSLKAFLKLANFF